MRFTHTTTALLGFAALGSANPKKEPFPPHIICGDPPLYPCGTSAAHKPPPTRDIVESVREIVSQYFTPTTTKTHTFTHKAETWTVTLHKTTTTKTRTRTSTGWETTTTWAEKRSVPSSSSATATSTSWPAIIPLPEPTAESMTWSKRDSNPILKLKNAVLDFWHDPVPQVFRKKNKRGKWPCPCSRKEYMARIEFYSGCNDNIPCVDNTMPCPCDPKFPRKPRCDPELPCLDARFPCPCLWDDQPREWGYWIDTKCIDEIPCAYYPRNCTRLHPENCRPLHRTWQINDTQHYVTDEEDEDKKVKRCEKGESAQELMSSAIPSATTPLGTSTHASSSSDSTSHTTTDLTAPFATPAPLDDSISATSSSESTAHAKTDFTVPFATPAPPTSAAMRNMPVFSLFRRQRRKGGGCWFSILFCKRGEDPLVPKIPLENATWHDEPKDAARYVDLAAGDLDSKDPDWRNVGTGPRGVTTDDTPEHRLDSDFPADWKDVGLGPRATVSDDTAEDQANWGSANIKPRKMDDKALFGAAVMKACETMAVDESKVPEAHNATRCVDEMRDFFSEGVSDDLICTFDRSGSYDDCIQRLFSEKRAAFAWVRMWQQPTARLDDQWQRPDRANDRMEKRTWRPVAPVDRLVDDATHSDGDENTKSHDLSHLEIQPSDVAPEEDGEEIEGRENYLDLSKRDGKINQDIDGACSITKGHFDALETRQCQDDLLYIFKYGKTPDEICRRDNPDLPQMQDKYDLCRSRIKTELWRYSIFKKGDWSKLHDIPEHDSCKKGEPLGYFGRCGIGIDGKSIMPGETAEQHNRKTKPADEIMIEGKDGVLRYPFQPDDTEHGAQGTNG